MDINKLSNELKKKCENELQKYQYLGAEFKNSRLKLSKTLESMNNVSKSVSYISKVENNKIIPNKECLEELCDELFINKKSLNTLGSFEESLDIAIESVFFGKEEILNKLYEDYKDFTNLRTDLMSGLYFFYKDDYKQLKLIVDNLSKVESSLTLTDYFIYVLLSVKMLISKNEIISAIKVIKLVKESNKANKYINLILSKFEFEIKLSFGLGTCNDEYDKLIKMYVENMNYTETNYFNKIHLKKIIEISSDDYLKKIVEDIQYDDLKFYTKCRLKDFDLELHNDLPIDIKLYYYYINNNITEIIKLIENNNLSEKELIKANYYKLLLTKDKEQLRDYITNVAIPFYLNVCCIDMLLVLFNNLVEINSQLSKYKEITIVAKKITTLITEVIKLNN